MKTPEQKNAVVKPFLFGAVILVVLILLFGSFYTIPAGNRGVLLTFGKAHVTPMGEGLHFKFPFVQDVVKMEVKTQKYEAKAGAASQDLQTVSTDVAVNYYINPESTVEIYQTIGLNYQDKIIQPAVQEAVKASTASYTAEQLVTIRPEVKDKIETTLRDRLGKNNIIVQAVSITDFQFSEAFDASIEAKVTAEQNALAAKNKLVQVEYESQARTRQAQAEADAINIQAKAIQSQGGKDYVQLQAINKWDGHMPQVVGGGVMPFVNIGGNQS